MKKFELIATTTFGLEAVVKKELKKLGIKISQVKNGRVFFEGDYDTLCRANLWLRSAERVLLKMGSFKAENFDELYEKTGALPWQEILPENAEFPVLGRSIKSKLHSVPSCQSIVKKSIVDKMQKEYGSQWFSEKGPLYTIEVELRKDIATLTIDTSGDGLHKRGYRKLNTTAPLQETIAAAMIYLSRWHKDRILIDPFTGSGTIPIEAAMMAQNIAPGLHRSFASQKWSIIPQKSWIKAEEEAKDLINHDNQVRLIMGNDIDDNVIGIARYHAKEAGVENMIHFQQKSFVDFSSSRKYGYIITNPPYGERINNKDEAEDLYRLMGRKLKSLKTWSYYILTSNKEFEKIFGKKASKRRKLYNGGIETHYYQYYGPRPSVNDK